MLGTCRALRLRSAASHGVLFAFRCRDPKKAPPEALTWLTSYLQSFQDALEAPDWLRQASWWGCRSAALPNRRIMQQRQAAWPAFQQRLATSCVMSVCSPLLAPQPLSQLHLLH